MTRKRRRRTWNIWRSKSSGMCSISRIRRTRFGTWVAGIWRMRTILLSKPNTRFLHTFIKMCKIKSHASTTSNCHASTPPSTSSKKTASTSYKSTSRTRLIPWSTKATPTATSTSSPYRLPKPSSNSTNTISRTAVSSPAMYCSTRERIYSWLDWGCSASKSTSAWLPAIPTSPCTLLFKYSLIKIMSLSRLVNRLMSTPLAWFSTKLSPKIESIENRPSNSAKTGSVMKKPDPKYPKTSI